MAATTSASSSSTPNTAADSSYNLVKQIRSHEVAIAELNNLPSSRAVYQRNGNIFFRTSVPKATIFEQRQLDAAKAGLQKLNSAWLWLELFMAWQQLLFQLLSTVDIMRRVFSHWNHALDVLFEVVIFEQIDMHWWLHPNLSHIILETALCYYSQSSLLRIWVWDFFPNTLSRLLSHTQIM